MNSQREEYFFPPRGVSVFFSTFLPWILPTGGVACAACLMAHIISSIRAPSSSYIKPDSTGAETGVTWVTLQMNTKWWWELRSVWRWTTHRDSASNCKELQFKWSCVNLSTKNMPSYNTIQTYWRNPDGWTLKKNVETSHVPPLLHQAHTQ